MPEKFDVVIIGAGPAGIATAITTARKGLNTLVIERGGIPGEKNMFGGVLFKHPFEKLIPNFVKIAPLERKVIEYQYWILLENSLIKFSFKCNYFKENPSGYTALRARFDPWFAKKAEEAGAVIVTKTTALDVIRKNKQIIGVETDRGEVYGNIIVAADGANSFIAEKAGLHKKWKPEEMILGVKEVIEIPMIKINEMFNLSNYNEGVAITIIGGPVKGMTGGGFLYTNKDSLSIGVGALISDLAKNKKRPNELIEEFKKYEEISNYIKDGTLKEYSAHLIPEGGYYSIPKLYTNGLIVVGDAAMLVNVIGWEGTNFACESGILAGETVIYAHKVKDFSENTLKIYEKMLNESFILKDLRKFRRIPQILRKNKHVFSTYPEILSETLKIWHTVDGTPKEYKLKQIGKTLIKKRSPIMFIKDIVEIIRGLIL